MKCLGRNQESKSLLKSSSDHLGNRWIHSELLNNFDYSYQNGDNKIVKD